MIPQPASLSKCVCLVWVAVGSAFAACSADNPSQQTPDGGGGETASTGASSSSGTGTAGSGSGMVRNMAGSGSSSGMAGSGSSGVATSSGSSSGVAGSGSGADAGGGPGGMDAGVRDAAAQDAASELADGSSDATGEAAAGDANVDVCAACGTGSICVEDATVGGAFIPPNDAGQCPNGLVILPQSRGCSSPPSMHCVLLPAACTAAPGNLQPSHCACVPSICPAGLYMCKDVTSTLTQCLQAVP